MHYGDSCVLMNTGGVYANASAANMVVNNFNMDVVKKLSAKVEELELTLGQAVSKLKVQNQLVIEAASAALKFSQDQISFAGGTVGCGGNVTAGAPASPGPFLNVATQQCLYCGATHGATSFLVAK